MKERPILFSAPMVRALLDGSKMQTRRILKADWHPDARSVCSLYAGAHLVFMPLDEFGRTLGNAQRCPNGGNGDRLWVRETIKRNPDAPNYSFYGADGCPTTADAWPWKNNALPSIHCPRGLSRIDLEITGVRVERLQDISREDAISEGIRWSEKLDGYHVEDGTHFHGASAIRSYQSLWESINGAGSWDLNPWVWVVEFKQVKESI